MVDLDAEIQASKEILVRDHSLVSGTVPVALSKFGSNLPDGIGSARIFTLRANTHFKTERHPNSRQRVLSLEGQELDSLPASGLEKRWATVEPNLWHQPRAGSRDWVVLTFHEASEQELIDEYLERR